MLGPSSQSLSPEAYFDGLALLYRMPRSSSPAAEIDLHLLAFLGCIVGLFRGTPTADWGYRFALTDSGFPFSAEFQSALRHLERTGLADQVNGDYTPASGERVAAEFEACRSLTSLGSRVPLIEIAADCTLVVPAGAIRYAVTSIPTLKTSSILGQSRPLLETGDSEILEREYDLIRRALKNEATDDLSPVVLWLTARVLREGGEASGND